ncbi:spore germination protein [Sporomusa sp. KB1]|jgi:spore germination protein KA|uniref:spore germination protein n=1 Tax=Sporomusa sp. KB1 TaxID=943346 RepID=UPI0011AD3C00|nr:spore germination protein [Sporomusa sp. KB1]TWH48449.1 spore germination protein KA [Sporomusa sp. KB1]
MQKIVSRIYNYFRNVILNFGENQISEHYSSQKYLFNSAEADMVYSAKSLEALLTFAERLLEVMQRTANLLKSSQVNTEIEIIKAELEVLERQFLRLSPLALAYEKNSTGQIEYSPVSSNLSQNLEIMKGILASSDIIIREFDFGLTKRKGSLIYVDGLTDKEIINNNILTPLMRRENQDKYHLPTIDIIQKEVLTVGDIKKSDQMSDLKNYLLAGESILFIDGISEALIINTAKWETRGVEKPDTDNVVRGPREGFSESIQINLPLLRRKIHNSYLRFEIIKIGHQTKTDVCIAYLSNVANDKLVEEIKIRLNRINTDAILDSGYIEAFIEDSPYSIFATIANSEKPDIVAAKLLEGRAAILVDGSPIALTVPTLLIESFQSPEDYYVRPYFGSLLRLIRFLAYFISVFSPAVYVALITFHQELIPTPLLIAFAAGRGKVPFPAVFEALAMGAVFEILREAGVRLPRPVGSAVSIVGALVIGQTAVSAGLISPIMVIVVGITAISSFVIPAQADSSVIVRLCLLLAAGIAGGFGILMVTLTFLLHLASLRSFGIPFLSPFAPLSLSGLKDAFFRVPLWAMTKRPAILNPSDIIRQGFPARSFISENDKHSPRE